MRSKHSLDLLKQMRGGNWQKLAADLGVSVSTLKRWRTIMEDGQSPGKTAAALQHQLFHKTLNEYDCDWISISFLNFDNIRSIGGRK